MKFGVLFMLTPLTEFINKHKLKNISIHYMQVFFYRLLLYTKKSSKNDL